MRSSSKLCFLFWATLCINSSEGLMLYVDCQGSRDVARQGDCRYLTMVARTCVRRHGPPNFDQRNQYKVLPASQSTLRHRWDNLEMKSSSHLPLDHSSMTGM
ncbi:hypothetical protein KC19_VG325200 [Ceratodon purpureus]|uniref:Secreted protein n=1 Tax=Ceratodon purpureus TaxID=3225 RepID=A0A8T0HXT9_CERPU|nr:hypothetical protein KC19_VG325200 [Ceratodon purpureus]